MQTYMFTYMHATLSLWIKTRPIDLEIDEVIIDTLLSGHAERKCLLNSRINSIKYEHPTCRISIWLGAYINHLKWRTLWSTPRYLHPPIHCIVYLYIFWPIGNVVKPIWFWMFFLVLSPTGTMIQRIYIGWAAKRITVSDTSSFLWLPSCPFFSYYLSMSSKRSLQAFTPRLHV